MLKWLANLLSGGDYDGTKERLDLVRESEKLWETYLKLRDAMSGMEMSRDAYRQVLGEAAHERDCALDELDRVEAVAFTIEDYQVERINQVDRSRRGWKWLYEQKCEQWTRGRFTSG